jgi:hypothetical protein
VIVGFPGSGLSDATSILEAQCIAVRPASGRSVAAPRYCPIVDAICSTSGLLTRVLGDNEVRTRVRARRLFLILIFAAGFMRVLCYISS